MLEFDEQMAHSTVDLHLKEISEYLHGNVMNKSLPHWAVHKRYSSYTPVSRSTYTHKIQPVKNFDFLHRKNPSS